MYNGNTTSRQLEMPSRFAFCVTREIIISQVLMSEGVFVVGVVNGPYLARWVSGLVTL